MTFLFKTYLINYDYIFNNKQQTILFLHGWGGNKNSFISAINFFKHNYNILSISMPPTKKSCVPLTMYDYKHLILQVLTLHNISKVNIICHSFGMRVSLMLASSNLIIEKLIVTGGAGINTSSSLLKKINSQHKTILLKKHSSLFNKFASADYKILKGVDRTTFKNIVNKNLTDYIKLLKCPTLLFWGNNDKSTPLTFTKIFQHLHSNTKTIIVKGSHFAYLEYSSLFINTCNSFLQT